MKLELSPKCSEASKCFTENDWRALVKANEEISARQSYGVRTELAYEDGVRAMWSNGSKAWICSSEPIEKDTEIHMDANEIFLPVSPERCKRIQPCMEVHPLYYNSSEAWVKGEVSQAKAGLNWALRQLQRIKEENFKKRNK